MKTFKFRRSQLIWIGLVLVVVGLIYWRRQANQPTYQEYLVQTQVVRDVLELSGEITAAKTATLRFGAGGYVTYLGAQEGDTVKKWQTLASVDTRQLHKVLEQKLNLYAIQRATFDQTIDDNDNSIPDGELGRELTRLLAKNQYQLDNTVLDVEYQDLTLRLARLTSPLDGILVQAPINVANVQVAATDTWLVVDPNSLQFVADLDETDLAKVQPGQKVIITLDAYPAQTFESEVGQIAFSPKETSTGTTYEVTLLLPSPDPSRLRLGLNGTAAIVRQEKPDVLTLPSPAITYVEGKPTALIFEDGQYQTRQLEVGIESDGLVEIVGGLSAGDKVYVEE